MLWVHSVGQELILQEHSVVPIRDVMVLKEQEAGGALGVNPSPSHLLSQRLVFGRFVYKMYSMIIPVLQREKFKW